jgi:hypothetical protein
MVCVVCVVSCDRARGHGQVSMERSPNASTRQKPTMTTAIGPNSRRPYGTWST